MDKDQMIDCTAVSLFGHTCVTLCHWTLLNILNYAYYSTMQWSRVKTY